MHGPFPAPPSARAKAPDRMPAEQVVPPSGAEKTKTMTNYNKVVKIGHSKIAEARVHGVYAAAYRFDKHRVHVERDGTTSETPFSQFLYLLRLPGEDRKLWLTPAERQRVLEALQEVDPIGSPQRTLAAVGAAADVQDVVRSEGGDAA